MYPNPTSQARPHSESILTGNSKSQARNLKQIGNLGVCRGLSTHTWPQIVGLTRPGSDVLPFCVGVDGSDRRTSGTSRGDVSGAVPLSPDGPLSREHGVARSAIQPFKHVPLLTTLLPTVLFIFFGDCCACGVGSNTCLLAGAPVKCRNANGDGRRCSCFVFSRHSLCGWIHEPDRSQNADKRF